MSDLRGIAVDFVNKIFDVIRGKDEQEKKNFEAIDAIQTTLSTLESNVSSIDQELSSILPYLKEEYRNSLKEKEEANLNLNVKNEELKALQNNHNDLKIRYDNLQDEKSNLTNEVSKMKEENLSLLSSINTKEANISELSGKCSKLENEKASLEEEIKNTKSVLDSKSIELEQKEQEIQNLKPFEDVFKSEKIMALLNALLNNKALKEYREKEGINDDSPRSIYNLIKKLDSGKLFINSYYESLVKYKQEKDNQNEMSSEETDFYLKINKYFDKELIINPESKKINGSFTKAEHRGIGGETSGDMDDGIILIPSDSIGNDKIKVKLKK